MVPLGHDAIFFRTLQQVADLFQAVSLREMPQLQFDPAAMLFEFRPPRLEQLHRPLMPRGLLAESLNGLPLGQAGRDAVQVGSSPAGLNRRQFMGNMLLEFGQRFRKGVTLDQGLTDAGDLIGELADHRLMRE